MTINDIIALANSGFTKQDISTIMVSQNAPEGAETPSNTATPTEVPSPAQTTVTTPNMSSNNSTPDDSLFNQLFNRLDNLQQTLVSNNIATVQQPTTQSSDDIIAEILNPPTV